MTLLVLLMVSAASPDYTQHEGIQQLYRIHCLKRSQAGLPSQRLCPRLCGRAQRWANTMAASHSMRHSGMRIRENVAAGQRSTRQVMSDWMNSSGHRANLLSVGVEVGFGYQASSSGKLYWVSLHSGGSSMNITRKTTSHSRYQAPKKRRKFLRLPRRRR